jgi:hypothetical protein
MRILALLGCLALAGCATMAQPGGPVPSDSYCQIANPVRVSPKDTRATKEQADREFRKWKSICGQ